MKFVWGVLCFLLGASIYLLFRDCHLLVFHLLNKIGLYAPLSSVRQSVSGIALPDWFLYSLPDGLWCLAYVLVMDYVASHESLKKRISLVSIVPVLGIGSEILQYFGLIQGTFDPIDLLFYFFATCLCYLSNSTSI